MSYFSETIKKLRTENGYTQKEVCTAIGISQGNYSGLESGKNDPSLSVLIRLSNFYDEFIDTLVQPIRIVDEPSREEKTWYHRFRKLDTKDQTEIQMLIEIKLKNAQMDDDDK